MGLARTVTYNFACCMQVAGEKRSLLQFHPRLAPIKAAVLPLVKNKPELVEKARAIFERLQRRYYVQFDAAGQRRACSSATHSRQNMRQPVHVCTA